jgi:hypothetical protein
MLRPPRLTRGAFCLALALAAPAAPAQVPNAQQLGVFVYPAESQPPEQQRAEETECYGWAQKQTGIDPTAPPPPPPAPEKQAMDGSAVKGAAVGAAAGTAIGAIAGDTGEGAAIGAVAGALRGRRMKKQKDKQEQQVHQQQVAAQQTQVQETFKKAYGACLEGKGYTVK